MSKYYSLKKILEKDCPINMIIGERSNGKTFACLEYAIKKYFDDGSQLALVRRWQDDFKGKRGQQMFDGLAKAGVIEKASHGKYNDIYYYSGRWYFCKINNKQERITCKEPFAFGFALSSMEHDKSTSYPNVRTIVFDEFLTMDIYHNDEFLLWQNVVSTIVRDRDDVKIFMLGNTVSKYSPYFAEMNLTKIIKKMEQGTINIVSYRDERLKVAVEYCSSNAHNKKSNFYFAFDNPNLEMITTGAFEFKLVPHCPTKYRPKDIKYKYFIEFDEELLQCEVIIFDNNNFTYIHRKSTPIKDIDRDMVYSLNYSPKMNYRRNILKPTSSIEKRILSYFTIGKVFYQDNELGSMVANYMNECINM